MNKKQMDAVDHFRFKEPHPVAPTWLKGCPSGCELMHTATVLQEGWEGDNRAWLIRCDGEVFMATTGHGTSYIMKMEELDEEIQKHTDALESLVKLKTLYMESV